MNISDSLTKMVGLLIEYSPSMKVITKLLILCVHVDKLDNKFQKVVTIGKQEPTKKR